MIDGELVGPESFPAATSKYFGLLPLSMATFHSTIAPRNGLVMEAFVVHPFYIQSSS